MTDRKPDIITQWKIKDNQDGTYTARCPAMPNVELTADNIVTILGKIEGCLKSMYPDNSQVDGGITGINAEYSVTKRMEQSLDCFNVPTDDPTPEPATDAPELHEDIVDTVDTKDTGKKEKKQRVKHNCESCVLYSSFGNCANAESPLCNQFVKEPYKVCKHHKKTLDGNYVHNKIVTKPEEQPTETKCYLCRNNDKNTGDCSIGLDVCNNHCKSFDLIPGDERLNNYYCTDGEYEWRPIKALEAGCAQCERIQTGDCIGNYAGTSCGKYHARGDSGEECRTCKHRMLIWNEEASTYNKPFCTVHKADISDSDYCCYAYKEK